MTALLHLLPALLLFAALVLGRYPGERAILARRRVSRRPRTSTPRRLGSAGRVVGVPVGTLLLAFHRAIRPPPAR